MVEVAPLGRRRHCRYPVGASADLAHEPSRRAFPCRLADASAGGALVLVPIHAPLRPGHRVVLRPREPLASQLASLTGKAIPATVVRVDRQALLTDGCVGVGIRFDL